MANLWRAVTGVFSLHDNAAHGRLALLRSALALRWKVSGAGPWIDAADPSAGTTALHAASYNGHLAVVRMLVSEYGASTSVLTHDGWSALHCAAINGYLPVVRYLLEESRVCPTLESKEGWTALHCAAAHGFLPVVRYLVERTKMDVDLPTYSGWTALHWACCNGYLPVVKYLIQSAHANRMKTTSSCGSNIMHVAARQGQLAVVEYLCSEELVPVENAADGIANAADAASSASSSSSSSPAAAAAAASSASIAAISVPISAIDVTADSSSASASAASGDDSLASVSISAFLSPRNSAAPSQALMTRPILPRSSWVALNDGGASPFLLAALRGKLPLVLFLATAIGRDNFTFDEIQKAHDSHQALARAKGRMLNHQLLAYLREWMSEITYKQTVAAPFAAAAASAAASSSSSSQLPTLEQVDAESRRLRELMLAHERGERPDLGLGDDDDDDESSDEEEEEKTTASLDAVAEEDDDQTDSDAEDGDGPESAARSAAVAAAVMSSMDNAHVVRSPVADNDEDEKPTERAQQLDLPASAEEESSAVHRMLEEYARSHAGVMQPLTRPGPKACAPGAAAAASSQPLRGTSQTIEKSYERLTAPPDAASVRPSSVLAQALALVQQRWSETVASDRSVLYESWARDQLRSMRQDLTVQGLCSTQLARGVYQFHAQLAELMSDASELGQCRAQLKKMDREQQQASDSEQQGASVSSSPLSLASAAARSSASPNSAASASSTPAPVTSPYQSPPRRGQPLPPFQRDPEPNALLRDW